MTMTGEGNPNSRTFPPVFDAGRWSTKPIGSPFGWTGPTFSGCSATPSRVTPRVTVYQRTNSAGLWPSSITTLAGARLGSNLTYGRNSDHHIRPSAIPTPTRPQTRFEDKDPNDCADNTAQTPRDAGTGYGHILNGGVR